MTEEEGITEMKYGLEKTAVLAGLCLLLALGGCARGGRTAKEAMSVPDAGQKTDTELSGSDAGEKTDTGRKTGTEPSETDAGEEISKAGTVEVRKDTQEAEIKAAAAEVVRLAAEPFAEEFTGGYPLDLVFFEWLSSEYGGSCILEMEKELHAFSPDPELWHRLTGNTVHVLWLLYQKETGGRTDLLENVEWKECASPERVTLAFTGDINFSEGYPTTRHLDSCANGLEDCFSEDLLERMRGMDILMINNEFTYSTRGEPLAGKTYTFRADPGRAKLLHTFGTDIVNLANNHVYDYGPDALLDTIETLKQEKIPYVGAGANLEEASRPCYFICNGRKIAIVSATQIERSSNYTKEATEDTPGVLKTLNPDKFVEVIEAADQSSDCVIAVVHWGTEGNSDYGQDQARLAQAFAEAGADAIIGGHTHCLQGFEMIGDVPVIYSLGNFWFSSSTLDTGLAQVTIDRNGDLALSFIPCIQERFRTRLVTEPAETERIFDFLQKHSARGTVLNGEGFVLKEQQEEG